jgi:peptidoglycan-N-acetylglucosamine deacetylase
MRLRVIPLLAALIGVLIPSHLAVATSTHRKVATPSKPPRRIVYLTFDGGPSAGFTARILPILKKHNCRVTCFVVGKYLMEDRRAAGQLNREGNEIEIHTWTHPFLTRLKDARIQTEVQWTADTILKQTGRHATLVRPPYGDHNARTDAVIDKMGYKVVMWQVSCGDFALKDPRQVVELISRRVRPGSVVLLHVTRVTWKALPALLTRLDKMGYSYGLLRERS